MKDLLGVKFSEHGQVYPYLAPDSDFAIADFVLCNFENTLKLAKVAWKKFYAIEDEIKYPNLDFVQKISPSYEETIQKNQELSTFAHKFCKERAIARNLDMKLVDVEFFYDNSKVIFYFTAPSRIDFRDLVKDLVRELHTRIELRQIGVRHETQMLGALGNCGQVVCCRSYLANFAPVTIKMAKEQNLFLNPAKISGLCGRLLCCLSFEQENYDNFQKICPKLGKRYQTNEGYMRVLRTNMFRNSIIVQPDNEPEREMDLDQWQALKPHRNESSKSSSDTVKEQIDYSANFQIIMADPDNYDNLEDLESLE